jgi:hypothetical protein
LPRRQDEKWGLFVDQMTSVNCCYFLSQADAETKTPALIPQGCDDNTTMMMMPWEIIIFIKKKIYIYNFKKA